MLRRHLVFVGILGLLGLGFLYRRDEWPSDWTGDDELRLNALQEQIKGLEAVLLGEFKRKRQLMRCMTLPGSWNLF